MLSGAGDENLCWCPRVLAIPTYSAKGISGPPDPDFGSAATLNYPLGEVGRGQNAGQSEEWRRCAWVERVPDLIEVQEPGFCLDRRPRHASVTVVAKFQSLRLIESRRQGRIPRPMAPTTVERNRLVHHSEASTAARERDFGARWLPRNSDAHPQRHPMAEEDPAMIRIRRSTAITFANVVSVLFFCPSPFTW